MTAAAKKFRRSKIGNTITHEDDVSGMQRAQRAMDFGLVPPRAMNGRRPMTAKSRKPTLFAPKAKRPSFAPMSSTPS